MAISSFFDRIVVNNPQLLVDYVNYMEELEKNPHAHDSDIGYVPYRYVTDPKEMDEILRKGIERWGKKK